MTPNQSRKMKSLGQKIVVLILLFPFALVLGAMFIGIFLMILSPSVATPFQSGQ